MSSCLPIFSGWLMTVVGLFVLGRRQVADPEVRAPAQAAGLRRRSTTSRRSAGAGIIGAVGVELLYIDGCPHGESYLPHLRRLVASARPEAEVRLRKVTTDAEAREARFLGSPTVRVNDRDIDPGAADRADYALTCRVYRAEHEVTGTPPDIWVIRALTRTAEA